MTTGLTPASYTRLQLNAGLFLKNFDPSAAKTPAELKSLIADAILQEECVIGATRGGGTFQCKPEMRQIDADGLRCACKGSTVNDRWVVKMTGTMLEITPANFAAALACADVEQQGQVTCVRARMDVQEADYIPSLCWVGDTSRGFVVIQLDNVLNMSGAAFTFTDRGEGTLPFEFQAHLDGEEDEEYAPFRILFLEEMEG